MSWFRSEAHKAQNGRTGAAEMAAMTTEARGERAAGTRLESEIAAHARARNDELRREEHRLEEQRREELRREEQLHLHRAAEHQAALHEQQKVEDAVVTRERSAAGDMPVVGHDGRRHAPLFSPEVAQDFRARWDAAQIGFVDDPHQAVQQADELVAQMIKTLVQGFTAERKVLEGELSETASTENLRVALQRYRSFFQRLITL